VLSDLMDAITSWKVLTLVLLVFGFAPRFVLRLILLAYRRSDPRRAELLAEINVVPRIERPVWVAEQLETALCEGVWERVVWAATGRVIECWRLGSGVKMHCSHPDTFWIPDEAEKAQIVPGVIVKLMFELTRSRDTWGERMWVEVVEVRRRSIIGRLVVAIQLVPLWLMRLV